jgi:hypothetical protein
LFDNINIHYFDSKVNAFFIFFLFIFSCNKTNELRREDRPSWARNGARRTLRSAPVQQTTAAAQNNRLTLWNQYLIGGYFVRVPRTDGPHTFYISIFAFTTRRPLMIVRSSVLKKRFPKVWKRIEENVRNDIIMTLDRKRRSIRDVPSDREIDSIAHNAAFFAVCEIRDLIQPLTEMFSNE